MWQCTAPTTDEDEIQYFENLDISVDSASGQITINPTWAPATSGPLTP